MGRGWVLAALGAPIVALASAAAANGSLADRWLGEQNAERERVGVPRLAWSGKLAEDAQAWANQLAREGAMRHAGDDATGGQGENLWMGDAAYYGPEAMIQTFLAERRYFRPGTYPQVSTTGRGLDVGHYSQIVWRTTQQVGCALAHGRSADFLVCRYWPAGNWRNKPVY